MNYLYTLLNNFACFCNILKLHPVDGHVTVKNFMKLNTRIMINNSVKLAQYKLSQHRLQGTKSKLNIFEVAQLMDAIKNADQTKSAVNNSIFYSIHPN